MKKLVLFPLLIAGFTAAAQTARYQVIHNSADRAADSVDVYLNGTKAIDNFAFRTATKFADAPAGTPIMIGIAPKGSSSAADTIFNLTVTLTASKTYIIVANGLISGTGYTPAATAVPFRLSIYDMGREQSATAGNTDLLVLHGSTDAPTVDVKSGTSTLVNDISFGEYNGTGYLSLPEADYTVEVTNSAGTTVVKRYSAPLSTLNLGDSAITVLASGFLDPSANSGGAAFGLFVAQAEGGALLALPELPTTSIKDIKGAGTVRIFPNPATDKVTFSSDKEVEHVRLTDLSGRLLASEQNTNRAEFNLSNLSSGLYFMQVVAENGALNTFKITKP